MTTVDDTPVVVRFGAMGDMILLTVLLQALARRHGRPVDLLSSGGWTPALLAHDPAVRELRLVTSRKRPYWLTPSQWQAVAWLRAHRGPVILCDADDASAALLARAGVEPARLLRAWDHRPAGVVHWADWWVDIAQKDPPGLPGPAPVRSEPLAAALPRIVVPPAWRAEAEPWMASLGLDQGPVVLLQPGNKKTHRRGRLATSYSDKHWDAGHWGQVARGIWAALPGACVAVCGSAAEAGVAQDVLDAAGAAPAGARALNLARHTLSLPRLAVLARHAHSMVSVDTGPAHLAAAMDCPLVVLYGSAGSASWRPRAPRAPVVTLGPEAPTRDARIDQLAPDTVLQAWQERILPVALAHRASPTALS